MPNDNLKFDKITDEWEQSGELGELAKALAAAQGEMENAAKSKANPFFKSKYADLAAIKDVSQATLTKHVLAIVGQNFSRGPDAGVRMMLLHGSGQYLACICTTTPKDRGPQAMGSCWSYLRRYAKSALLDIATEDDDGEKAEGRDKSAKPPGANWGGKPANEGKGSAPKAAATGATTGSSGGTKGSGSATGKNAGAPLASIPAETTGTETGEVLDAGQLADLTEAFDVRWGKGAKTAVPSWLKANFGTDNPANLTKVQASEALQKLLAS